jgi:protein O-GlcNAc transferase
MVGNKRRSKIDGFRVSEFMERSYLNDMQHEAWLQEARGHYRSGRIDNAVLCYQQILRVHPTHVDALIGLADALEVLGRNSDAVALLEESLRASSCSSLARARFADSLQVQGDLARAIEEYRQVVAVAAGLPGTWWGLGCAQASLGDHAAAVESFQRLVSLQPENGKALLNLGKALFELGQVDPAIHAFRKSVEHLPAEMQDLPVGNIAVAIPGSPTAKNQDVFEARRAWAARSLPPVLAHKVFPPRPVDPHRPLRLGYVSAFFATRNWMKPVWGLIGYHDLDRFQVHILTDGPAPDPHHGYHQRPAISFHNVDALSNADLARFIEEQAIDVLVDLNAFSRPSRLPLFALKPAPVQVAWFNQFAPSGMTCIDHLIGDAHVITGDEEIYYSETIVRVPRSYLTFQVPYPVPDLTAAPCLKNGYVTFGCLAPQYKITTQVVEVWSRILKACPGSCLVLKNTALGKPAARDFVYGLFARFAIAANRVDLDGPAEHFQFLERYADIDVALDTFPYNGGTTTMEALWQEVPVVTFVGDRWAARISASLLREALLAQFVAADLDGYVARAVALARDPDIPGRLDAMRRTMRDRLRAAPVCDVRSFAREMERAYCEMWRRRGERSGPPPRVD